MKYIVDFNPYTENNIDISYYADIEKQLTAGESISQNEAENFLRVINYITRTKISTTLEDYENKCDLAQSILGHYFEDINCNVAHCSTQSTIAPKVAGHNFSVINLLVEGEERAYLLDPTYIQFFTQDTCNASNYVVSAKNKNLILLTPSPGYFIKEEDQDAADFLLRYGYIELTDEYAKMYGDSFYNTDRGLKLNPTEFKSLPGTMYKKSFKSGAEPLSTSKEKLLTHGQAIIPFQDLEKTAKIAM